MTIMLYTQSYEAKAQSKPVIIDNYENPIPLILSEGFEVGDKPLFNTSAVKLKSGLWLFSDAAIELNPRPTVDNRKVVRIVNNGKVSMQFDIIAKKLLTFEVGYYVLGNEQLTSWAVFVSYNNGLNYKLLGRSNDARRSAVKSFLLKQPGKVRFEIRKLSGGKNALWFDNIEIRTSSKI